MPPVLKIKRSATSGSAPASLSDGELAVNTTDKKLYVGTSGSVVELTGGAGGGITSIGLNVPSSIFTSNGTITSNGSLGFSLNNQNANLIFASPDNTSGAPSFRTLVPKDLAASGTANQYLQINSSGNLVWNTISTSGGAPSGTNGQIQLVVKDGGVFDSLTNFQILTNSSYFFKNNIITVPTQNTTYSKINFPFNNIFSENDIVGISTGGGATTNYVIRNVTNTSFKTYALPTSSGSAIGSLETLSGSNTSSIQLSPPSNSTTPLFFTGTLKTPAGTAPSTITVATAIVGNFKVGMQITSGVRPVIIRGCIVDTTSQNSVSLYDSIPTTTGILANCYVDVLKNELSTDASANNAQTNAITCVFASPNTYISSANTTTRIVTFNQNILGRFNTDTTSGSGVILKKSDTETTMDIVVYQKGAMRSNTYITHIDAATGILTLNQRQHNATDTAGVTLTGYATFPERNVFSFGTPLYKTTSEIITNESICLIKQINDANRNLEQKILFKAPEAYTISVSAISTATVTLSVKNNLIEMCVGDIILYGTSTSGTTQLTPTTLTYIKSINYNNGTITLNSATELTGATQLTIRSSRYVKSVIEHRSFPYDSYNPTNRFNHSNIIKYARDTGGSGSLDYDLSSVSYEKTLFDVQKGSGNNLGSINDMGLYICSDTSIKIGISAISRGANVDNKSIKEPIDSILPHISIEPLKYTSDYYNGIYFKNVPVNNDPLDNSNYFYVMGCKSATPRKNDGANFLTWYRLSATSISSLIGGPGTTVNPKEEINEITGLPELVISLADEVPINTSLTVPLIKGTAGGDLNITTESPDSNIVLSIPQSNTDVVLSTGNVYITSGLDAGDVYVQSAEDVYLTSQNVRVSGNLIVDGYIQSGTGFQGDNTDAEEPITGLVMDGGTF